MPARRSRRDRRVRGHCGGARPRPARAPHREDVPRARRWTRRDPSRWLSTTCCAGPPTSAARRPRELLPAATGVPGGRSPAGTGDHDDMTWPRVDGLRALGLGEPGRMRAELNALVLAGRKRATAGLLDADYRDEDEALEVVGERLVLVDDDDRRLALVEVTDVRVVRFDEVTDDFAGRRARVSRTGRTGPAPTAPSGSARGPPSTATPRSCACASPSCRPPPSPDGVLAGQRPPWRARRRGCLSR